MMTKPTIFLASSVEGLPIARELARQLSPSANTTLWSVGAFNPGKTITESLAEAAARADFAVFVLTAEDSGRRATSAVPRANVLFELGFLAGTIGLARTCLVVADSSVLLPTDLAGILYMPLASAAGGDVSTAIAPVAAAIRREITSLEPRTNQPEDFFSCFISYSWADKDFAAKLHDDLRQVGVRSWLDAKQMQGGERMFDQIERAVQAHDKLLVILSRASIGSPWVKQEVRKAFELEHGRNEMVLFPIRLDDAILAGEATGEIDQLRERYILNFSEWQDRTQYQRSFSRLVRDLAISASVASSERS